MTPRGKHLEEMRYALAHDLSLPEAARRLAAEKRRSSERAIENLRDAPVVPTRDLHARQHEFERWDAPWMGRD